MRILSGCVLAIVVAFAGADDKKDDKIDAKKLVGKWEPKKDAKFTIEFTKDGKLIVIADKDFKIEGTYKLDGNKLEILMKAGENEVKDTILISKLTDDEMEGESQGKKTKDTFKRIKEK